MGHGVSLTTLLYWVVLIQTCFPEKYLVLIWRCHDRLTCFPDCLVYDYHFKDNYLGIFSYLIFIKYSHRSIIRYEALKNYQPSSWPPLPQDLNCFSYCIVNIWISLLWDTVSICMPLIKIVLNNAYTETNFILLIAANTDFLPQIIQNTEWQIVSNQLALNRSQT